MSKLQDLTHPDILLPRIGSNINYSDSYSAGIENLDTSYQGSYLKAGLVVGLGSPDDSWNLELIGDNINDEIVFGKCNQNTYADAALGSAGTGTNVQGPSGQPEVTCHTERGRSVWMRLTVNFR